MDKPREELRKLDINDVLDYIRHEAREGIWVDIGDSDDIFDDLVTNYSRSSDEAITELNKANSSTGLYALEVSEDYMSSPIVTGINSVDALLDIVEYQMPIAPEIIVLKQELEKL